MKVNNMCSLSVCKATEVFEGNYKIYEVAEKVGYNSQTNFGRSFLKQFGITPRDYLNIRQSKSKPS